MKLRDAIAAGIVHLAQNRLRARLSILGICIGIASVLCMMAVGDGAKLLINQDYAFDNYLFGLSALLSPQNSFKC